MRSSDNSRNKIKRETLIHIKTPPEFKVHLKVLSDGLKIYTVKIIFLGDTSAGKTSLIRRWIDGKFPDPDALFVTIGIGFHQKDVEINEHAILRLQIWDFGGTERFFEVIKRVPRLLGGAVFTVFQFDMTLKFSLGFLEDDMVPLIEQIYKIDLTEPHPNFVVVLGNRSDLMNDCFRVFPCDPAEISDFLEKYPQKYFSVSARTGDGLEPAMKHIIERIEEKLTLAEIL